MEARFSGRNQPRQGKSMASVSESHSSSGYLRLLQAAVALGAATAIFGLWQAPQQTWANLLLVSLYLLGLGTGGLVWLSLHDLTGARWSDSLKPIRQAMSAVLPVAAVGLLAVLICRPSLYAWTSAAFAEEPGPPMRHIWLNRPFFLARAVAYLAMWVGFAAAFLRMFRAQESANDAALARRRVAFAAAFLVVFGITCWLASLDWIMSLEPRWTSTIFGVYNFGGLFLSSLAATIVLVAWKGSKCPVNASQLHDLGTLLFAFSSFWMYLWFCQYWLIWYVNNPEETIYYVRRSHDNWPVLVVLNLILNWGIPFGILLVRSARRNSHVLGSVALVVLMGRWLDLFLMIFPSQPNAMRGFGAIEIGLVLGAAGVFLWTISRAQGRSNVFLR
jgi:hypothetical protein